MRNYGRNHVSPINKTANQVYVANCSVNCSKAGILLVTSDMQTEWSGDKNTDFLRRAPRELPQWRYTDASMITSAIPRTYFVD